jgi:integrase
MSSRAAESKSAAKRQVWNKGLTVGQRDAFTPAQVKRIRNVLVRRGEPGLRDLALFSVGIDTMLRGQDLVTLLVKDVQGPNGAIRSVISVRSAGKNRSALRCALTRNTAAVLARWIAVFDLKAADYVFPSRSTRRHRAVSVRQLGRLLKMWVAEAGIDPKKYSTESLRRTKALHILNNTGDLEAVRVLLGHQKIESTSYYLRIRTLAKKSDPIALSSSFKI